VSAATHPRHDDLVLAACGEPGAVEAHLRSCAECRATVEQLAAVVTAARRSSDTELVDPPPSVRRAVLRKAAVEAARSSRGARAAWRRRSAGVLAAAAALVLVGLLGVTPLLRPAERLVAATDLEALAEVPAATARLLEVDGALVLALDVELPPTEGYYEAWLIDTEVAGMVSLGPVPDDRRLVVPDGLSVDAFPVVDVSVEPFDGDPTHSGDSVLRGVLPTSS
jgi:hypothetical protein